MRGDDMLPDNILGGISDHLRNIGRATPATRRPGGECLSTQHMGPALWGTERESLLAGLSLSGCKAIRKGLSLVTQSHGRRFSVSSWSLHRTLGRPQFYGSADGMRI